MPPSVGLPLLVLAMPFVAFLLLAIVGPLRRAGRAAGLVSIAAITVSFAAALIVRAQGFVAERTWGWIPADGGPIATVGVLVDPLSSAMLVLVTLVSLLVQVYSLAYLSDERPAALGRYYTYQSLFVFSMLGLVLAPGFLQMFVFWELVGLCSYLLIGFWYERPAAARAAVKAFWITKLGDVGFIVGIVLLWSATGTFEFTELFEKAQRRWPSRAWRRSCSSSISAPSASRPSSRSTCGSPTRWRGRRPSPRSSTRRRWSPPASSW